VLVRINRLGKQLEAVCASIKEELVPDEDRKQEILREWKETQKEAAKPARQFWFFWGIIAAVILGWLIIRKT
jgi:hypothetical protein